jgi:glycerophosphoryl diester phosphodiesterase
VRLTGDGALVLCHDSRLDRTTDGRGRVAAHSLAAIRRVDAGRWFSPAFAGENVPTLDETLLLATELGLATNIEIKAERGGAAATAAAVAAVLERLRGRLPPLLVSSFLPAALIALRERAPAVPRGQLLRLVPQRWQEAAVRLGAATINIDHRRLNSWLVAEIRGAGYPLLAYTVNDPERARRLFDWGVSSVFSDLPDIIPGIAAADAATQPFAAGAPPTAEARQGAIR